MPEWIFCPLLFLSSFYLFLWEDSGYSSFLSFVCSGNLSFLHLLENIVRVFFPCRQSLLASVKSAKINIPEGWKRRQGMAPLPQVGPVTRPVGWEHWTCLWSLWAKHPPKNKLLGRGTSHNTEEGSNTSEEAWVPSPLGCFGFCPLHTLTASG